MDKSPDAFRTISEVADHLDTPAHVLRFWETRFPQIRPVKRAGGRRYYRPSDVALLAGIRRLLHDDGLTIRGVQKILRDQGVRHVAALSGAAVAGHDADLIEGLPPDLEATSPEAPAVPPEIASGASDHRDERASGAAGGLRKTGADDEHPVHDLPLFAGDDARPATPGQRIEHPELAFHDNGLRGKLDALREAPAPAPPDAAAQVAVPAGPPAGPDIEVPDLGAIAARLRALPPGALALHRDAVGVIAARLAALRERAAPGPRG